MSSNERPCPIWESAPKVQDISEVGCLWCSHQAGGRFWLMQSGAALLQGRLLTERRRVNLSYWIYEYNLRHRMINTWSKIEEKPNWDNNLLNLNQAWVEGHWDRTPSAEDRMLNFLREMIRRVDAGEHRVDVTTGEQRVNDDHLNLLQAAGGCGSGEDFGEMQRHAAEKGWIAKRVAGGFHDWHRINFPARLYVEERTRDLDLERQGFVAMSFDPGLTYVYEEGIEPAIEAAGYEGLPINRKDFTGDVVDEIMAEIRKSRFVVANFTACKECTDDQPCNGARGGVYFEAGFALGLGKTVFLTCREGCAKAVHFDIDHLNRIESEGATEEAPQTD